MNFVSCCGLEKLARLWTRHLKSEVVTQTDSHLTSYAKRQREERCKECNKQ